MKYENYIFTGFGFAAGQYKITNSDIENAIESGNLQGLDKERIEQSEEYQNFCKNNPNATVLKYFAGEIMGFKERYSVVPFPARKMGKTDNETALELAVKAVQNTIKDAQIQPENIDAWFVSTVSPHQQAPGIAASIKSFFQKKDNYSPTFSTISGCAGFLINLEKAVNFLKTHENAKNVIVAHTETMSQFLTQRTKFVPFVTFGDLASAVMLSKKEDSEKYGIIDVCNFQDVEMIDYVGVDAEFNLYTDDKKIKDRAIINMPEAIEICLKNSGWKISNIDKFIPHQTGNIIIKPTAEKIGISPEKVYSYAQNYYGNVSGATIPLSFTLLKLNNQLIDNQKIIAATAGVGGNYGAFSYISKQYSKTENFICFKEDLKDKTVVLLCDDKDLEVFISNECKVRSAKVSHFNLQKSEEILFSDSIYDYVIISLIKTNDNMRNYFYSIIENVNKLIQNKRIAEKILIIGSSEEDSIHIKNEDYISACRALHGFFASASGEFASYNIETLYLKIAPSFYEHSKINFAKDVVSHLYFQNILNYKHSYENAMKISQ